MDAEIFNAISDPDFRIKAFSDYCDDTQQSYQRLIQAETLALESIPDDPDDDVEFDYETRADEILASLDISPYNMLLFNEGYISSRDYIASLLRGFKETIVDENGALSSKFVDMRGAGGDVIASVDLDHLTLEVKENLYSLTALCAANSAATINNVADRIAIFNDRLTSVFQNAYSTVSTTATYLRSMVSDLNFKSSEYLARIDALMGVSALAEDNSASLPVDMDITKYTGANPACALNFNGAFNSISTVANLGLKVVGGILSAGARLVSGLFSRVSNFFHQTLVDPYDIEEVNSNASSYTVDGWRFNADPNDTVHTDSTSYYVAGTASEYMGILTEEELQEYVGKWIKYETIFGEMMFNLDQFTMPATPGGLFNFKPIVQFKPRAVNPDAVYLSAKAVWGEDNSVSGRRQIQPDTQDQPTKEQLLQFLEILKSQPELYLTTDADEKRLCLAFCCGASLTGYFGRAAYDEMLTSIPGHEDQAYYNRFSMANLDDWISIDLSRRVTNLDFVSAVSGWSPEYNMFLLEPICPRDSDAAWRANPFPHAAPGDTFKYFFLAWVLNRADRKHRPFNYTFVPYRNNVDAWAESRFRIRTDAENRSAFETLITTVVVTVVAAVLSLTVTIGIKKAVRNLYMRRTAAVGVLDNAMWRGEALTSQEKRKYVRLQRKLNASSALSSGMQDSVDLFTSVSDAVSTVSEDASGVAQITSLIKP